MNLDQRLQNWGECWRRRIAADRPGLYGTSAEHGYRSRGALHWDWDAVVGTAPRVVPGIDARDAFAVELAAGALDVFHHVILKGEYVRQWAPERTLRVARKAAGNGSGARRTGRDYPTYLAMARALLAGVLDRPAAIRRARAAKAADFALDMPGWQ